MRQGENGIQSERIGKCESEGESERERHALLDSKRSEHMKKFSPSL